MRYNSHVKKKVAIIIIFALMLLVGDNISIRVPQEALVASTTPSGVPSSLEESQLDLVTVVRVVDGDTIIVDINGKNEKIRLIGVDTPETVDPRKPVQCFGKEASTFTKNLLEGKQVRLEGDSSQGDRDKYGRLLRYVFLPDDTFVNKEIITQGYGHEYTYRIPYHYQKDFKTAERSARSSQKGLWPPTACSVNQ